MRPKTIIAGTLIVLGIMVLVVDTRKAWWERP